MNTRKNILSFVSLLLCAVVTLAAVMNVFGDNSDVEALAQKALCSEPGKCAFVKTSMTRTPIGQSWTYSGSGKSVEVTCRRSAIVFGSYACNADPAK